MAGCRRSHGDLLHMPSQPAVGAQGQVSARVPAGVREPIFTKAGSRFSIHPNEVAPCSDQPPRPGRRRAVLDRGTWRQGRRANAGCRSGGRVSGTVVRRSRTSAGPRGRVQIRRVSQANQLPRRHRSARVGQRPVEPGQVGMDNPQSAQLLTRIGVNDCSRPAADDRIPAAAARGDRAGRQCPSRRTASPVGVPPGRPAVARWRPAALLSPHAARSAAPRRSRAGRP